MSNHWKGNLVIFTMTFVPTHSNVQIKIWFSSAPRHQPRVKVDKKISNKLKCDVKTLKKIKKGGFDQL